MALQHRKFKLAPERSKWVENRDTTLQGEPVRLNPRTAEIYAEEVAKEVRKMHLDVSGQIERLFASSVAKGSIQNTEKVAIDAKGDILDGVTHALDSEGMLVGDGTIIDLTYTEWIVSVEGVAMDASISSLARILTNKLVNKWTKRFNTFGKDWTKSMMGKVETQSAKDLSRSMEKLSGGLTIKTDQISDATRDKILASADQASSLIKTIGSNYTDEVKQAVARAITDDTASFSQLKSDIHSMLQDKYKKHKNKAFNVAKDQMRKSYTAVTASRMKDVGVGEYIWRHGGGVKEPRPYHKNVLNGQTFSLDDPPIIDPKTGRRGKPGDDYYCSCYMQPVISFNNKKAP